MYYNEWFVENELPSPLSQSELFFYFEKMKSGDITARDIIIKHNIRLVLQQVNKLFSNVPYEKKELVSVGLIGLIRSVDFFDVSKNIKFATYSARYIDNEIFTFLRKEKKYVNVDSLDRPFNSEVFGDRVSLGDTLCDENLDFVYDYECKEEKILIRQLIENLPERDKKIITLYFGFIDDKPLTQREIGDKLGISQSYVTRLIAKILKRIKKQLNESGIIGLSSNEIIKEDKKVKKSIKK